MKITHRNYEDINDFPEIIYKYRNWNNPLHQTIIKHQIVFMAPPSSFKRQERLQTY
jgi:hypothetical protein